jgi:hypothetical protein
LNSNGRPPRKFKITSITRANPGYVRVIGEKSGFLSLKLFVQFKDLNGMNELEQYNEIEAIFEDGFYGICDTSHFSSFNSEKPTGYMIEVKKILHFSHSSLQNSNLENISECSKRNHSQ